MQIQNGSAPYTSAQLSTLATANNQASAAVDILLQSVQKVSQNLHEPAKSVSVPVNGKGGNIDIMA